MIVVHLIVVKKFNLLFIGWIFLLANIFNCMFNLFINNNNNNREPITDESLFHAFDFFIEYCFGGGD